MKMKKNYVFSAFQIYKYKPDKIQIGTTSGPDDGYSMFESSWKSNWENRFL